MNVQERVDRSLRLLSINYSLFLSDPEVWSLEVLNTDPYRVTIDYGAGPILLYCTDIELELHLYDYFTTLAQVESL